LPEIKDANGADAQHLCRQWYQPSGPSGLLLWRILHFLPLKCTTAETKK